MLEFIKSKDYRKFIEDNNVVINDWDMATIIINNGSVTYQNKKEKLSEIAERTDDKELEAQILNHIDVCEAVMANIKRADSNAFYELCTKSNRTYEKEGTYLSFENAYAAGVAGNVPFHIEKCRFTDCAENYVDRYIGTAFYTAAGDLLGCLGNSSPVKKVPDGRKNIEDRYVDLPYMFRYGDVVRIVGTDTIGIISAFRTDEEELEYRKKAKNWDYSDFQIYVDVIFEGDKHCTDFHHVHAAPMELEYFAFDENDKRKGYMDYLVKHKKMTSLWGGGRRKAERIPYILDKIKEIWEKIPDMRLGQLMAYCGGNALFALEDEDLLDRIIDFLKT